MKTFQVAVFVQRGKRGWKFRAYTRDYNPSWEGCNMVTVTARNGASAKQHAIDVIKANMNLNSKLCPSGVNCYEE